MCDSFFFLSFILLTAHPVLASTATLLLLYIAFYLLFVVHRPEIYGRRLGGGLAEHLLQHCPILSQSYWPTFWAWHHHGCTILREYLQKRPNLSPKRQILTLDDGGTIALDWFSSDRFIDETPILIILPGLTGSTEDKYIRYFVLDGLSQGYRTIVFNQRGNGGINLTTPRLYCATNMEDLKAVLDVICSRYPVAQVTALGVSLGGMILVRYLTDAGTESRLKSAVTFSVPWNAKLSRPSMENRFLNRHIYQRFLAKRLRGLIQRNAAMLRKDRRLMIDQALMSAKTVTEFDSFVTAPMFGYDSCDEYYSDILSTVGRLDRISVPLLSFTSDDDPFIPPKSVPLLEYKSNPLTVFVVTKRGGHFGYLEGIFPSHQTWMNRAVREYLHAMKSYQ